MIDLKRLIEYYRRECGDSRSAKDLGADEVFGDSFEEIIFDDNMLMSEKEKLYREHQKTKYSEWFADYRFMPSIVNDDFYKSNWADAEFNQMVDYQLHGDLNLSNPDQILVTILSNMVNVRNQESEGDALRFNGLNQLLRKYVSEGYNIYPLMICLDNKFQALTQNPDVSKDDLAINLKAIQYLSQAERVSPYSRIFRLAEELGALQIEEVQLISEGEDTNAVVDRMINIKEKIAEACKEFDLYELESVLNNKRNYLKQTNSQNGTTYVQDSSDANMYKGLLAVLLYVQKEKNKSNVMEEDDVM